MGFHDEIINYVFPFRCAACANLTTSNNGICSSCWPKFNFISEPYCYICCQKFHVNLGEYTICGKCISQKPRIDMMRSLFEFSLDAKQLIHKFKYSDKTSLGKFFAKLIFIRFGEELKDVDLIAPVPMHKIKRIFRNYNPPQILAYELSKQMNKLLAPNLLLKNKMTKNQVGLTKSERAKNLLGSLSFNKNFNINGKVVLLVDDVLTTGATTNECSKVLKKSGASVVKLATIAKVGLW